MSLAPLLLSIAACTAPPLEPQSDLAGARPMSDAGDLAEEHPGPTPFSAWTAATPLTLVAPGGQNLVVLDRIGVRVEVEQVRVGRILVRCTGCPDQTAGVEAWLPRGVLWTAPTMPSAAPTDAKDPLSLALQLRTRWAAELDLPDGATAGAMCHLLDHGFNVTESQAETRTGGGHLRLKRLGSTWTLATAIAPKEASTGSCG